MNRSTISRSWAVIFVFIFLIFTFSSSAQKSKWEPIPTLDTTINPHDFTDKFYQTSGVNPKEIMGRRKISDGFSVFGWSSNPYHTYVRVIGTIPAYNQNGELFFWYPLGEVMYTGFTNDEVGVMARETAKLFPIYVFPKPDSKDFTLFSNNRQATLIDDSWRSYGDPDLNPLGIRQIFVVNYTEKAFTKEGVEMMAYFGKKNGYAADDTPLIKSVEDINHLWKSEFIRMYSPAGDFGPASGRFAISPIIVDPTNYAIAQDAFLWMATKDGKALPGEEMFLFQFGCLQKTGAWCKW